MSRIIFSDRSIAVRETFLVFQTHHQLTIKYSKVIRILCQFCPKYSPEWAFLLLVNSEITELSLCNLTVPDTPLVKLSSLLYKIFARYVMIKASKYNFLIGISRPILNNARHSTISLMEHLLFNTLNYPLIYSSYPLSNIFSDSVTLLVGLLEFLTITLLFLQHQQVFSNSNNHDPIISYTIMSELNFFKLIVNIANQVPENNQIEL